MGPAGVYAEIEPVPVTDSRMLAACATCWIVPSARPQQAGIVITPMTGRHTGGSYCGDFCVVGHQLQDRCDLRAGQVHQRADELDSGSHCRSTDSARKFRVPAGKLAPWGYVEYFPGWFAPGPELTNTPTIPKPR